MRMMKHWKVEGCDAKDFWLVGNLPALRQRSYPPLPSEGERIEVRGFGIAACSDATLTLTLSLEKGEANGSYAIAVDGQP
jgi:hypothetical protein